MIFYWYNITYVFSVHFKDFSRTIYISPVQTLDFSDLTYCILAPFVRRLSVIFSYSFPIRWETIQFSPAIESFKIKGCIISRVPKEERR